MKGLEANYRSTDIGMNVSRETQPYTGKHAVFHVKQPWYNDEQQKPMG
jgi:hypothetical protein